MIKRYTNLRILYFTYFHWCTVNHPGQLSLLPSVGWEMSTGQCAVLPCGGI